MEVQKVNLLIQEAIQNRPELFVVSHNISPSGNIEVIIDGDKGATLEDCIMVSRHVEHNLDREVEDFSLMVTTPDITKPIQLPRQYNKNIGRVLQVETDQMKHEGTLIEIENDMLVLEYKARVPKEIGKGKQTVVKQDRIKISEIKKAKVKIVYNA
jgi:ribosome maturation factor RimP